MINFHGVSNTVAMKNSQKQQTNSLNKNFDQSKSIDSFQSSKKKGQKQVGAGAFVFKHKFFGDTSRVFSDCIEDFFTGSKNVKTWVEDNMKNIDNKFYENPNKYSASEIMNLQLKDVNDALHYYNKKNPLTGNSSYKRVAAKTESKFERVNTFKNEYTSDDFYKKMEEKEIVGGDSSGSDSFDWGDYYD